VIAVGSTVRPLRAPVSAGIGLVGAAAIVLAVAGAPADVLRLTPVGGIVVVASAVAVALAVLLAPDGRRRRERAAVGLAGLGGQALLVAVADPLAVAAVLLLLGFGVALSASDRPGGLPFRGPALAAVLLGVGWTLVRTPGPGWQGRVGALAIAMTVVAAAGLLPYLADLGEDAAPGSSLVAMTGFFGPALALTLPGKVLPGLTGEEAGVFGGTLVALGLVNLGWGVVVAARTASDTEAWRSSFLADWGLALVGLGLLRSEGVAAAYVAMLSILVVRVPLYLAARGALGGGARAANGSLVVLLAVLLAGSAPFSGFPVRVLVLQAATLSGWPLALPLLAAMLVWIAHAFRLARTVTVPAGSAGIGLGLAVLCSLALGIAPAALRAIGGL
jgi:hypothetical protein